MMRYAEIRLSGAGGQGLGLAGRIVSEAAMRASYIVCQTQSYGPEARGGASRTDIIVSKDKILFPNCRNLDLLLAMNQESADKFGPAVKDSGFALVDTSFVGQPPTCKVYEYPLTDTSKETFGTPIAANVIAVGMLAGLSGFFNLDSWREALIGSVPEKFREMNLDAFELGHREGRESLHREEGRIPLAYDRKQPVPESIKERFKRKHGQE